MARVRWRTEVAPAIPEKMNAFLLAAALVAGQGAQGGAAVVAQPLLGGAIVATTTIRVLAFSQRGAEALAERRVGSALGALARSYIVVGPGGVEEIEVSRRFDPNGGELREHVDARLCRERARALEDRLRDFSAVSVLVSGCATGERALVQTQRFVSALPAGEEASRLQNEAGAVGAVYVTERGPLTLIVGMDARSENALDNTLTVHWRRDDRIHPRWSTPPR